MPVTRVGLSAKAATTASVWAVSEICRHVDLHPVQRAGADHRRGVGAPLHRRPHPLQHVDEGEIALQGAGAQSGDGHAPANQRGGREDVGGRAGVGLDVVGGAHVLLRRHDPGAVVGLLDGGAEAGHHRDREGDVGLRDELTHQPSHQTGAHRGAREQQTGQELARHVTPHRDLAAPERAALHLDRQVTAGTHLVHGGAQRPHRVQDLLHRALPHPVRRIDPTEPLAQPGHGQQEPARRTRLAGIHERHVGHRAAGRAGDREPPGGPVGIDLRPERSQPFDHGLGVVGVQRVGQRARCRGPALRTPGRGW